MINFHLSNKDFVKIYDKVPRLCVDLIIKNKKGVLLALRSTPPYQNMWNIPGGAVYKDETIKEACLRIAKKETDLNIKVGKSLGYMEFFNESRFGANVHTVSVAISGSVLKSRQNDKNMKVKYFKKLPKNLVKEQAEFLRKLN